MVAEIHRRGVPAGDSDSSEISSRIDKDDDVPVDLKPWAHTEPRPADRQLPACGTTDDNVQPIAEPWRVLTAVWYGTVYKHGVHGVHCTACTGTLCSCTTTQPTGTNQLLFSLEKIKIWVMIVDGMTNQGAVVLARRVKSLPCSCASCSKATTGRSP